MPKSHARPKLPKKVRRVLSVDESLQRYFARYERYLHERLAEEGHLLQVIQRAADGSHDKVLKIEDIHRGPHGIYVVVR